MEVTDLPSPLREDVQAFLLKDPSAAPVVAKILARRADAQSTERARLDAMLVFMITPSRRSGWFFAGIIGVPVLALLGYLVVAERQHAAAVASGEPVVAKVTRMDTGNCVVGTKTSKCLALTLEMHPANRAQYTTTLTHDVPLQWMPRVQPGSWLTVAVDRTDPNKVYFDEASMAIEAPKPIAAP